MIHLKPSCPRFQIGIRVVAARPKSENVDSPVRILDCRKAHRSALKLLHRLPAVVCFLSSLTALAKGRGEDKVELKRTLSGSLCLLRQLSGCPFRCANLCFLSSSISLEISALTDALCLLRSCSASNCRSLLRQSLQYGDSASE